MPWPQRRPVQARIPHLEVRGKVAYAWLGWIRVGGGKKYNSIKPSAYFFINLPLCRRRSPFAPPASIIDARPRLAVPPLPLHSSRDAIVIRPLPCLCWFGAIIPLPLARRRHRRIRAAAAAIRLSPRHRPPKLFPRIEALFFISSPTLTPVLGCLASTSSKPTRRRRDAIVAVLLPPPPPANPATAIRNNLSTPPLNSNAPPKSPYDTAAPPFQPHFIHLIVVF